MGKTNKNPLCLWLCLFIGTICSAHAHSTSQQDIQELRTLGYSVLVNVLIYHNPNGTPYDLDTAQAYQTDLQLLQLKTKQLSNPQAAAQAERLNAMIADLRHLPQSRAEMREAIPPYSRWLPQVIEQQMQLSTLLSDLYDQQPVISERQRALHELSRDMEQLLLSYQISAFPSLVTHDGVIDAQTLGTLDSNIHQRFAELSDDSELGAQLKKAALLYQSVRRHLLDPATNWSPSTVARHLLMAARRLDSAAGNIAR